MKTLTKLGLAAALIATPSLGLAQDGPTPGVNASTDSVFIFNSLLFLIGGFLVFWMAAGFAMLEAGLVRSKNVAMQLTKNIALFSLAAIFYYLIGYNLMYPLGTWSIEGVLSGVWGPGVLEAVGVFCFRWSMDIDLVGSETAKDILFDRLGVPAAERSSVGILVNRRKQLKRQESVLGTTRDLQPRGLPNSYKRIRRGLPELVKQSMA